MPSRTTRGPSPSCPPTMAERIRTLADGVRPMMLSLPEELARPGTDDAVARFVPAASDDRGRPLLLLSAGEPAHRLLRDGGAADLPVCVDVPDVVHLGGSEAVRGRLRLLGWLAEMPEPQRRDAALRLWERHPDEALLEAVAGDGPEASLLARMDLAVIRYEGGEAAVEVDLEDYEAAEPDPVHAAAQAILGHINAGHREEVAMLARAAAGSEPPGAAWMWELDRFGATMLVRRGPLDGDPDHLLVRIPWLVPVDDDAGLQEQLRRVMVWAHSCACPGACRRGDGAPWNAP